MNVIDQRILIPRSPRLIWDYVSDLSKNPGWQVDCTAVSFLSSRRTGPGVRWRYATSAGREQIAEITAWYDGLGYEYVWVDGAPFKEGKGRLRLQEIAEGTIVQWTISYQPSGMLGGVRNALSIKRRVENSMADSLRALWKVIQQGEPEEESREAKSLMRDAPDYESRVQYRPRHPSHKERGSTPASPVIEEPAVSDEDTRPRSPVVIPTAEDTSVVPAHEPEVGAELLKAAAPPVESSNMIESALSSGTADQAGLPFSDAMISPPEVIVPRAEPPPDSSADIASATPGLTEAAIEPSAPVPMESNQAVEVNIAKTDTLAPDTIRMESPALDRPLASVVEKVSESATEVASAAVSVFDVFGVPRPSQVSEDLPTASALPTASDWLPPDSEVADSVSSGGRTGFRLLMRRRKVRLRRP